MSFCAKCGTELEPGAKFCPKCGTAVDGQTVESPNQGQGEPKQEQQFREPEPLVQPMQKAAFMDEVKAKYFCFYGRLNRKPYFLRGLLLGIISGILISLMGDGGKTTGSTLLILISAVVSIIAAVGQVSLMIRRCHDLNRTGWLAIVAFIPILNIFLGIYMLFFKGTTGPNRFGEDPLEK